MNSCPTHRRTTILGSLAVMMLALVAGELRAANVYWTNSAGGDFTNAGNWKAAFPTPTDSTLFTNNASYGVTLRVSVTNANVGFQATGGTVLLDITGTNTWLVTGGSTAFQISPNAGNNASLILTNSGSIVVTNSSSSIRVGGGGTSAGVGTLTISNGTVSGRQVVLGVFGNGTVASQGTLNMAGGSLSSVLALVVGNSINCTGTVLITGGQVSAANVDVGNGVGSVGTVTVAGGALRNSGTFYVGTNATTSGSGSLLVSEGGVIESVGLVSGLSGSGTISNRGGVYQFTTSSPTITANSANSIVLTNGTVSFRGVTAAAINGQIANITYQGANTLRLDSSTNALGSYAFTNGGNFNTLELVNNGSAWQGPALLIGNGGTLRASNAVATMAATLTNSGTIQVLNSSISYVSNVVLSSGSSYLSQNSANAFTNVLIASDASFVADALSQVIVSGSYQNLGSSVFSNLLAVSGSYVGSGATNQFAGGLLVNSGATFVLSNNVSTVGGSATNLGNMNIVNSRVTYNGPVFIGGNYFSDPSTNVFSTNVVVTQSGSLYGSNGDLFVFEGDLANQSTNRSQFNMVYATVLFTNSGAGATSHTLSLSNSYAFDMGSNILNIAAMSTNFGIGTLSLASNNTLTLTGTRSGGTSNALYVGWLDLQAIEGAKISTNDMNALTNALVSALNLPDINLYYDKNVTENAYLGGQQFSLWGSGGMLIPIPEPGSTLLVLAGLALLYRIGRQGWWQS